MLDFVSLVSIPIAALRSSWVADLFLDSNFIQNGLLSCDRINYQQISHFIGHSKTKLDAAAFYQCTHYVLTFCNIVYAFKVCVGEIHLIILIDQVVYAIAIHCGEVNIYMGWMDWIERTEWTTRSDPWVPCECAATIDSQSRSSCTCVGQSAAVDALPCVQR